MKTIKLTIAKLALITLFATNNAYAAKTSSSSVEDKITQVQKQVCKKLDQTLHFSTQNIMKRIQAKAELQLLKRSL